MTDDDLADLIAGLRSFGTDVANVEAKRSRDALPRSVRDTLSAFSNTRGGVIVLGVDEERGFVATGVGQPKRIADALSSLAADEMEPPLRPLIALHQFEGEVLVTAEVPELPAGRKPCYYRGAGLTRGSFVRVGDADRQLSPYEVHLMLASRGQPREDEEPVPGASIEALEPRLVALFCERQRLSRPSMVGLDDRAVLRRSRVLVVPRDGGPECVTLAGLLALGEYPQGQFPQLNLTFVHYPTPDGLPLPSGLRFLDNAALDGPIPVIVRDAQAAVRRNMTRRAVMSGAGRADLWEYPEATVREAVVNALVHRDLSAQARGSQVIVEMYPDRLHVANAGGLFGTITVERLGEEGISSSRNALLMRILEDVPLDETHMVCENRGSGMRIMIGALRGAGMGLPVFSDRVATFHVTFPNHTLMDERTVAWIAALDERGLTDSQVVALAMLRDGEPIDNARYRAATNVDSRIATVELSDLVARELIVQVGERRWAKYVLTDRARSIDPEAAGSRHRRADRRAEIMEALGDRTLSRADIARLTGLPNQTVGRWLAALRREGRVELTTGSPQSKHARYRRRPEPMQESLI